VVSVRQDAGQRLIILRPNRSADWHQNRLLWLFIFAHSALIAVGFALAGAWMILPFAGIELLLVGTALWYVNWKCSHQQVITVDEETLSVDKGVLRPRRRWEFSTEDTSVSVLEAPYPNDPPRVSLCSAGERVSIGEFLGHEELAELLTRLRACGLRVRQQGQAGTRRF